MRASLLVVGSLLARGCGGDPAPSPADPVPARPGVEVGAEPPPQARLDPDAGHLVPAKVVPKELPAIYDETGDMKAALQAKLAAAGGAGRRVLVVFGGNWCTWCHKLNMLFDRHEGIKSRLAESYERLEIDSNANEALLKDLGIELSGVPFLAVFDPDGKIVVKQETGSLEEGPRHDPEKVLAFLEQHKPEAT